MQKRMYKIVCGEGRLLLPSTMSPLLVCHHVGNLVVGSGGLDGGAIGEEGEWNRVAELPGRGTRNVADGGRRSSRGLPRGDRHVDGRLGAHRVANRAGSKDVGVVAGRVRSNRSHRLAARGVGSRVGSSNRGGLTDGGGEKSARGVLHRRRALGATSAARVDLERVNGPVSILEGLRVVLNVVLAGAGLGGAGRVRAPCVAGPVAAEGSVKYNVQILEMAGDLAATREEGPRLTPRSRVRRAIGDILGNGVAVEVPDLDLVARRVNLSSENTATVLVEGRVGAALAVLDRAARVVVGGIGVAVGGVNAACHSSAAGNRAALGRVQGHLVSSLGVCPLENVNFTPVTCQRKFKRSEVR